MLREPKMHVCSLRAWQKLRDVLKSWLQTSGKDDQMEKKAVCEELREVGRLLFSLVIILTRKKKHMYAAKLYNSIIVSTCFAFYLLFALESCYCCGSRYFNSPLTSFS